MPRPEKVQAVEKIREQFEEARATFVTEYRGLTVAEQQQLRRNVRKAQGEYRVVKMSLARRAVEGLTLEGLPELLVGPTALAFANDDPVPVAKVLRDFATDHDKLIIKGGIFGGALLPPEQISRLAEIESREVLLSRIAGGFKAPLSKVAVALGAKLREAASMFTQLLEKKEEREEPAEVAAEVAPVVEAEVAEEVPAVAAEVAPVVEAEVAEEVPAVAAEVAPAVEAEVAEKIPAVAAAKKPAPKKKAAPKATTNKSSAKPDAEEAGADRSDDTAEEE